MYKTLNNSIMKKIDKIIIKEINKSCEQILTDEIIPVTPLDERDLRRSLYTEHATLEKKEFNWISSGNIAPHNLEVHEKLSPNVKWQEPGTGPKYLENPVRNNADKYTKKAIKEGLKKNGF